ncbi:uncharacterized protein LOC134503530 [Candoia aspera]|uniref:uncharacterized protein LOC134503530 n=1 Tax=Candoia aspera TaxID=51853 RepID=UPI002FD8056C
MIRSCRERASPENERPRFSRPSNPARRKTLRFLTNPGLGHGKPSLPTCGSPLEGSTAGRPSSGAGARGRRESRRRPPRSASLRRALASDFRFPGSPAPPSPSPRSALLSSPAHQKGRPCGAAVRAAAGGKGGKQPPDRAPLLLLGRPGKRAGGRARPRVSASPSPTAPGALWRRGSAMASSLDLNEAELRKHQAQYLAQNAVTAASEIQELLDFLNSFKVQVGILGERSTGVSVLVKALLGKPCQVTNLAAYFREDLQLTGFEEIHSHPTFPHLTLHDLPGFEASEKPAAYLKSLGDLNRFNCFVMVVGTTGLRDTHVEVLKAIQQKRRPFLVARTKIDLDLHTARRRLRFRYNPAEQMDRIRKELADRLAKDRLEAKIFLVSGLHTERYDFAWLEDTLEGEVLNLKRHHDGNLKDFSVVSQKIVKELDEICKSGSLAEVPAVIRAMLEDPSQIRLNIAVIGETGSGNSSLINALRRVGCGEAEAAPTGVAETTRRATAYPFPFAPNVYLWDLPGLGLMEDDVNHLDLSCYSVFLLVASERYKHTHSQLARIIASVGKQSFFVRNKIDVVVEAQAEDQPSLKEELQEQIRKSCREALKNDGINCPVFLVSSSMAEAYDLPLLREELRSQASELKRKALRRAIPAVVSQLVRRESKMLMKDTWGKTLQISLSCVDNPKVSGDEDLLATIASFCIHLGVDEMSVKNTAQDTGKAAQQLQAEIQSRFARPMQPTDVLGLIVKPPSWSGWAWSYVNWGKGANMKPRISVECIYRLLNQVVVELAEDAERLLLAAFLED